MKSQAHYFSKYYAPCNVNEAPHWPRSNAKADRARIQQRMRSLPPPPARHAYPAGQPSGMPVPLNAMEKFAEKSWGARIDRERNIGPFSMSKDNRWQTMKNCTNWSTYNDIPRPYNPSDYTGFAKHYLG